MATKKTKTKSPQSQTAQAPIGAPTGTTQPAEGGLSIGDLKSVATIIDVASTRGAFRANEMAGIGLLYNKLQGFLAKVAPPEEKKTEAGAPTTVAPAEGKL